MARQGLPTFRPESSVGLPWQEKARFTYSSKPTMRLPWRDKARLLLGQNPMRGCASKCQNPRWGFPLDGHDAN